MPLLLSVCDCVGVYDHVQPKVLNRDIGNDIGISYMYWPISDCIGRYLLKYPYWKAKFPIRNVSADILNPGATRVRM